MKRLARITRIVFVKIPKHLCLALWYGLWLQWQRAIMFLALTGLFLAGLLVSKQYFNRYMWDVIDGAGKND